MNEPKSLGAIETLCADLDRESANLESMIAELEADLEEVKAKYLRGLKKQASAVARIEASLITAVERAPELFTKPRTITIHGVKVGFTISEGRVEWDDEASVVAWIRRHRKDDFDVLVQTTESPRKDPLRALPAADLAKMGCRIVGAGDQVVVKRPAGDVERLISALTKKLVAKMVEVEA